MATGQGNSSPSEAGIGQLHNDLSKTVLVMDKLKIDDGSSGKREEEHLAQQQYDESILVQHYKDVVNYWQAQEDIVREYYLTQLESRL